MAQAVTSFLKPTTLVQQSELSSLRSLPQPLGILLSESRITPSRLSCRSELSSNTGAPSTQATKATANQEAETIPVPVVHIDQHSEENATVVELEFGDRLGALLDTIAALKDLGLNVVKAKVRTEEGVARNRFVITQDGKKVQDASVLEAIRGTIISNLLHYHPESKAKLAMARGFDKKASAVFVDVPTKLIVESIDNGSRSELYVETADYPGLLLDIVNELKYLSIDVSSAEIDTEGLIAKDHFYISYHGKALDEDMIMNTQNALRYFLDKREIEDEESY